MSKKKAAKKKIGKSFISFKPEDFKGSYLIFFGLFVVGIFLPPVMSMAIIYALQRVKPKTPRLFDRNTFVYLLSLFFVWLVSLLIIGFSLNEALSKSLLGSFLVMIIIYPFVYAWLYFDWNFNGPDRKQ
ncbi:MAG: hypothetical protein ACOCUR_01075 [Nanoarchaeota archaeon]